jgi:preprotein translocase subunit SecE
MATKEDKQQNAGDDVSPSDAVLGSGEPATAGGLSLSASGGTDDAVSFEDASPATLGIDRYVHAAFAAGGVFFAYLVGKILAGIWNTLAVWPAAVRAVPGLLSFAEEQRPEFTMVIGAVLAAVLTIGLYRKPGVRQWSDEVAAELYKVHWPDRELVTSGTVVVIAASVFATVYIGLLDRIWAFITNLVYGA